MGLARDQIRVFAVKSRRQIAGAVEWPEFLVYSLKRLTDLCYRYRLSMDREIIPVCSESYEILKYNLRAQRVD